jgi:hypothetical protein
MYVHAELDVGPFMGEHVVDCINPFRLALDARLGASSECSQIDIQASVFNALRPLGKVMPLGGVNQRFYSLEPTDCGSQSDLKRAD